MAPLIRIRVALFWCRDLERIREFSSQIGKFKDLSVSFILYGVWK